MSYSEPKIPFTVKEERREGPVLVVVLDGRLIYGDGDQKLMDFIQGLINRGERALLLDCAGVPSIDSQGIKALVRSVVSMHKREGALKLVHLSPHVRMVLEVTRLLTVIEAFDDEEAALRSF